MVLRTGPRIRIVLSLAVAGKGGGGRRAEGSASPHLPDWGTGPTSPYRPSPGTDVRVQQKAMLSANALWKIVIIYPGFNFLVYNLTSWVAMPVRRNAMWGSKADREVNLLFRLPELVRLPYRHVTSGPQGWGVWNKVRTATSSLCRLGHGVDFSEELYKIGEILWNAEMRIEQFNNAWQTQGLARKGSSVMSCLALTKSPGQPDSLAPKPQWFELTSIQFNSLIIVVNL